MYNMQQNLISIVVYEFVVYLQSIFQFKFLNFSPLMLCCFLTQAVALSLVPLCVVLLGIITAFYDTISAITGTSEFHPPS